MQDYFNYFSEIEEHFCRRRGTVLVCSTFDWALMETWKEAGIPLEAVLRGIDAAFDRYDARPKKTRKINSLAYCAQEVLAAAEQMQEAALGATSREPRDAGYEAAQIVAYLEAHASAIDNLEGVAASFVAPASSGAVAAASSPAAIPASAQPLLRDTARSLRDIAGQIKQAAAVSLDDLERRLTILEEKLFAALLAATPDEPLVAMRAEAERELAPYRRNLSGGDIERLLKQYLHKRLLERYGVPRLSLFYM